MLGSMPGTIAAAGGADDTAPFVGIFSVLALGVLVVTSLVVRRQLQAAARARNQEDAARRAARQSTDIDREGVMFVQHRALNDLAMEKMKLEIRLMEQQLGAAQGEGPKGIDAGEYHARMMEKLSLEIESLKLHIHDQRKRLDDWGQFE